MISEEAKKELEKMLMESYDKGVADAREAAIEALEVVVKKAVEAEREACEKVCEEVMRRYKADTALDPNLNKVGAMSAELCALWIKKRGER
jgi:uncharacterized protein YpuA (DUF1002 family)